MSCNVCFFIQHEHHHLLYHSKSVFEINSKRHCKVLNGSHTYNSLDICDHINLKKTLESTPVYLQSSISLNCKNNSRKLINLPHFYIINVTNESKPDINTQAYVLYTETTMASVDSPMT